MSMRSHFWWLDRDKRRRGAQFRAMYRCCSRRSGTGSCGVGAVCSSECICAVQIAGKLSTHSEGISHLVLSLHRGVGSLSAAPRDGWRTTLRPAEWERL